MRILSTVVVSLALAVLTLAADKNDAWVIFDETFLTNLFSGLYYKSFTIIIYDRNDSGQYYKTTNDARIIS